METTFQDKTRYLRAIRFSFTKGLKIPKDLELYIKITARDRFRKGKPYQFALEVKHLVKDKYNEFVPEMLEKLYTLDILPFSLKYEPQDIASKMRRYIEEVEPRVESEMAETEILHKVARTDLRLLIFNGILSRRQSWQSSYSFKINFMENSQWFLKTEPLNRFIDGLFEDRCKNFRLAWKCMFKTGFTFNQNFGYESDYDRRMYPYKEKGPNGRYGSSYHPGSSFYYDYYDSENYHPGLDIMR